METVGTHEVKEEEGSSSTPGDNDNVGDNVDDEELTKVSPRNPIEPQVEEQPEKLGTIQV